MKAQEALERELKELIIETLNLEDMTPEEIESDAPLFGEGLSLDSIDALEIGLAIQKKYQIHFDAQDQQMQESFASITSLANFIAAEDAHE